MQILLIYCHPALESFQRSILDHLVDALDSEGHTVRIIDLYNDGFDPVLDVDAWQAHRRSERHAPDLDGYIEALLEAEALVLVYPTWWFGMPALLKGWLDRVWQPTVAFAVEDNVFRTHHLTKLKHFAVITTYGSPRFLVEWIVGDPARRQLMRGVAQQFSRRVRKLWLPIYDTDRRTTQDLSSARVRTVVRAVRFLASA